MSLIHIVLLGCFCGAAEFDLDWDVGVGDQGTTTVNKGDTVTWTWTDGNSHSVTSTNDKFTSSSVMSGAGTEYSVTFTKGGNYPYDCSIHSSMKGNIKVLGDRHDLDWDINVGDQGNTIIDPGDFVVWTWTDGNSHSVRSTNGAFVSSAVTTGAGNTYTITFTSSGNYPYDCSVHSSMQGVVMAGNAGNDDDGGSTVPIPFIAVLGTIAAAIFVLF